MGTSGITTGFSSGLLSTVVEENVDCEDITGSSCVLELSEEYRADCSVLWTSLEELSSCGASSKLCDGVPSELSELSELSEFSETVAL